MMPPKDLKKLDELYINKVENPSFNMEAWPKENFERICPGKAEYVGFEHVVESLMYLENMYGPGKVWSNFVAGIVPLEDFKDGFTFIIIPHKLRLLNYFLIRLHQRMVYNHTYNTIQMHVYIILKHNFHRFYQDYYQ